MASTNHTRAVVALMALVLAAAALALVGLRAQPAQAQSSGDFQCTGFVLGGVYQNVVVPPGASCDMIGSTVNGNVKALQDSRLSLHTATIQGNVQGDKAATVLVLFSTVRENIEIRDGAIDNPGDTEVGICGTTVLVGNVHIEKMTGQVVVGGVDPDPSLFNQNPTLIKFAAPPFRSIYFCNVGNNIQRGSLFLQENVINPDTQTPDFGVYNNRVGLTDESGNLQAFKNTGTGVKDVEGNNVAENIQCKENATPFDGRPNFTPPGSDQEDQCGTPTGDT
jgi:hypothetical protein